MRKIYLYAITKLIILVSVTSAANACKGCVSLDDYNFEKVIRKFKAVLVKFDVAYPYGDKHDVFTKFAEEVVDVEDLVVGEVGVKDYGEKENEKLAQRYGIKGKDDLPAVMLFLGDVSNPVSFTDEFTVDNLRNLVRDNTDLYIGLPGCLQEYDKLALEFILAGDKSKKLEEVEALSTNGNEEEQSTIKTYILFMKKILANGLDFVSQERNRLSKIIKEGKVNVKKKDELTQRLNILHSFIAQRDEL